MYERKPLRVLVATCRKVGAKGHWLIEDSCHGSIFDTLVVYPRLE